MKKRLPSVTVAVSALNEEANILNFLRSVLAQDEENYRLEKIIVYSDGSTDRTVEKARSLKDKRISVIDGKQRLGKSSRMNEIFKSNTSDIMIQSDADVTFANPHVITEIVKPFLSDPSVGLCSGMPKPLSSKTFVEKAISTTLDAYDELKIKMNHGHNVNSVKGTLLAFKKDLLRFIQIPSDIYADDVYSYFACITSGFKFRFVPKAVVYYRLPQTLKDHIKQNTRFLNSPVRLSKYFPEDLVESESSIPKRLLLLHLLKEFLRHPILTSFIFLVNFYCRLIKKSVNKNLSAKWQMATSTKSH
jgi:glycosyltransferase involved in cell wall biosynthesis